MSTIGGEAVARRGHILPGRFGTDRGAWIVWACFALFVVLARLDSVPSLENVFAIYREAGLRWLSGQDLYPAEYKFNYFPPSAVLFAAWSWLPFAVGGALWRIVNIAVFAWGLWSLSNSGRLTASSQRFFIATVVTVILSASAARYGQMTLAMAGLMMAAVAFVETGALWRAAVCAALAVALKPLAVVLLLLLVAIYPRLLWRSAVALALLFLLPFLFQHADYVWRQYAAVPAMLATRAQPNYGWQQNIFGLLDKLWWTATDTGQAVTNGAFAVAVMFLCWRARRHAPVIGVALSIYGLASCYILLFGSGTERNTYAMLAPVIGLVTAMALDTWDRRLLAFISSVILIMLLSYTLQHAFPHTVLAMAKPIAGVLMFAWLVWIVLSHMARTEQARATEQTRAIEREPSVSAHSAASLRIAIARQFLAFATVGVCGTATHYVTLIAGVSIGIDPITASALGWTLGAVVNYSLNYRFTFRSGLSHREAAPRFAVVAAIGLLLNTLLMAIGLRLGLYYLIAQVIATGVVLCCNFLLSRIWAFRERPRSASTN